jgi:hypothetical protein
MRPVARHAGKSSSIHHRERIMKKHVLAGLLGILAATSANAWEANVTNILQHGSVVAIYLNPDPGPMGCSYGQPYLLMVDDTAEAKQRFSMVMLALATGNKIAGYDDGCDTSIWAQSRPKVWRLMLRGP